MKSNSSKSTVGDKTKKEQHSSQNIHQNPFISKDDTDPNPFLNSFEATQNPFLTSQSTDTSGFLGLQKKENPLSSSTIQMTKADGQKTMSEIDKNGKQPLNGYVSKNFQNREGLLPKKDASGKPITYKEHDVFRRQRGRNRGAERVVWGSDGKKYYTGDHYRSFTPIN